MVAHKATCQICQRPSWSLWRYGRGFAGDGDISYRGFSRWRSALWCSFLLWCLPVLRWWSSPLVALICSVWSSAWLCLGNWWGWSFVVLALLQVAFLGKYDDEGLGPRGWPFSCLPNLIADCRECSDYFLSTLRLISFSSMIVLQRKTRPLRLNWLRIVTKTWSWV